VTEDCPLREILERMVASHRVKDPLHYAFVGAVANRGLQFRSLLVGGRSCVAG